MKKPIIGIVGRPDTAQNEYTLMSISENYRNAVLSCGGIPILILPTQIIDYEKTKPKDVIPMTEEEKMMLLAVLDKCDGILMPGGFRVYEYDRFICDYAIKNDKPLLGLCLGMQLMSFYAGDYTLERNSEEGFNHFQRDIEYVHKVDIVDNTKLKQIIGDLNELEVNSRHNYHITNPDQFVVSAYSFDNLIEAIEMPSKRFIMGIQWHVEAMVPYDEINKKIFTAFIEAAKK